jgi:DNA-binding MarR family transcriptional regulator
MSTRPVTIPDAPLAIVISGIFDQLVAALHQALPDAGFGDIRPAHSINLFRVIDAAGTRPTELARRAGITPQAMAEIVRYLEGRGYVQRNPEPTDGRGRIVTLTPLGRKASDVARRAFADLEREWERRLGKTKMTQLRNLLGEISTRPDTM